MSVGTLRTRGGYSVDSAQMPPGPGALDTPAALPRDRDRHQMMDRMTLCAGVPYSSVISMVSMTTSLTGLSCGPVGTVLSSSTTLRESASNTSPKMVWRFWSHGVATEVMK